MVKRSLFDWFLFFSIVTILVGIAMIIFIQFDRGYVVSSTHSEADFGQQQNRLIEYLNESNDPSRQHGGSINATLTQVDATPPALEGSQSIAAQVLPALEKQANTTTASVTDAASTSAEPSISWSYDDYERYWLSQNPWSPDYQPVN